MNFYPSLSMASARIGVHIVLLDRPVVTLCSCQYPKLEEGVFVDIWSVDLEVEIVDRDSP